MAMNMLKLILEHQALSENYNLKVLSSGKLKRRQLGKIKFSYLLFLKDHPFLHSKNELIEWTNICT